MSSGKKVIIVLAVIAFLAISLYSLVAGNYNKFVKMDVGIKAAWSQVENQLQRRYDLIPNLVETVKGYAAHEAGTFEKVVQARNMAQNATTVEDRSKGENMLTGTLKSLFAIAEAYPDLKANTNFMDLQAQLQKVEEDIANSRKFYNAVVREFNTKVESFPSNIIAGIFGFIRKPMFEVSEEAERQNVKVQF